MSAHRFSFRVEMLHGQDMRTVEADSFSFIDGFMIFFRKPPQGGIQEYWRVKEDFVISMETRHD